MDMFWCVIQKSLSDVAMSLICEAVAEKLVVKNLVCIRIADLGCSSGPNTLSVVENIINSVQIKYDTLTPPDFQVFFNDHASNDFNTLFKTLPTNKPYFAAGVPGSFYGRLFPGGSIHVIHSSFALHWLSQVPKEVVEKRWNKGRVHYGGGGGNEDVMMAFRQQYVKDMDLFLKCRAEEVVSGGLVVVLVPGRPDGVPHSECIGNVLFEVLGSCLSAMAKQGKIDEKIVESVNIPIYYASPKELEEVVDGNGCFTIERMEGLAHIPEAETKHAAERMAMGIRVGVEGVFKGHLQDEMIDELFESYAKRLQQVPSLYSSGGAAILYSVLRRN